MKKLCILSDFDGTITKTDTIYNFFKLYASKGWLDVEELWLSKKINSQECLKREFSLVENLSEKLINNYLNDIEIDETFIDFCNFAKNNIDIFVASDGLDYFINKIFENYGLKNIIVKSNHGKFVNGMFEFSFPNRSENCVNNLGTCKCDILNRIKNNYEKVIYVGDGVSDYCVADKADILFAKSSLIEYCKKNNIKYTPFEKYVDIKNYLSKDESFIKSLNLAIYAE